MQRGVFTLQKLDVLVSQSGSSKGVRDWVNTNLRDFATKYSNVKINVIFSKDRFIHPRLTGVYLNGRTQQIVARNKSAQQVEMLAKRLHDRSGGLVAMKRWPSAKTVVPSFQGRWTQQMVRNLPHQV